MGAADLRRGIRERSDRLHNGHSGRSGYVVRGFRHRLTNLDHDSDGLSGYTSTNRAKGSETPI